MKTLIDLQVILIIFTVFAMLSASFYLAPHRRHLPFAKTFRCLQGSSGSSSHVEFIINNPNPTRSCFSKLTRPPKTPLTFNENSTDVRNKPMIERTTQTPGKPFTHESLPRETMYILDGTGMTFAAYFSGECKNYQSCPYTDEMKNRIISELQLDADVVKDFNAGALMALGMQFVRFLRKVQPKYVAVAFDSGKRTFRKELYPGYKAQRPSPPSDIFPLFYLAPQLFQALGCRVFAQPGFEADDVMASLSRWALDQDIEVVHVSEDKDMLQLVAPGVCIMNRNFQLTGEADVIEKFGVKPSQLCDMRALLGDPSDNIPGADGIGEKTAKGLINHFNSIEELYLRLGLVNGLNNNDYVNSKTVDPTVIEGLQSRICESVTKQAEATALSLATLDGQPFENQKRSELENDSNADLIKVVEPLGPPNLEELDLALRAVRTNRKNVFQSLVKLSFPTAQLFRQLLVLRDDVTLEGLHIPRKLYNSKNQPKLTCSPELLMDGSEKEHEYLRVKAQQQQQQQQQRSSQDCAGRVNNTAIVGGDGERKFDFKKLQYTESRSPTTMLLRELTAENCVTRSPYNSEIQPSYFRHCGAHPLASDVLGKISPALSRCLGALTLLLTKSA